jgi:spermidine/putrescine transport system substrate-binding protein
VKKLTNQQRATLATFRAAREFNLDRRKLLKGALAAGTMAAAGPWIVRDAFSSSGQVNFMGWSGYDFKKPFAAFQSKTGIKVNMLDQPDQDSMFAQCKISLQTGAVDVVEPTLDRVPLWVSQGVVQGWDASKLKLDNYEDAFVSGAAGNAAQVNGQRYIVPSVWGTEAITHHLKDAPEEWPTASLADIFDPKYEGKVTMRAHSSLAAMGRVLDEQGKLPKPFLDSYKDEATMKEVWDIVLAEAIKHKANVAQFWNGENDAQAAFRTNGCVIGLTWDSTGYNLGKDNLPFGYISPKEGAFGWLQGYMLMKNAKNVDQAHEWAKFISSAEGSAAWATSFSANPVGKGGIDLVDPSVSKFYKAAYPGDALSKLWWWPAQAAWFIKLRGEYADKWKAA